MTNLDRRALIIGHWGPEGTQPNHSRVRGLVDRLTKIMGPTGRYPYLSMEGTDTGPDFLFNPKIGDITNIIADEADNIGDNTLFFLYYIGHAVGCNGDDIDLRLRYRSKDKMPIYCKLSMILHFVREAGFKNLVLCLDCCHSGETISMYEKIPMKSFVMLSTGKGYAFNCDFTEQIINTLKRSDSKKDQRIDLRNKGFTYLRLFEGARAHFVKRESRQYPEMYDNGLKHELIRDAHVVISDEYSRFVPIRTVYGRVYTCLQLVAKSECFFLGFYDLIKGRREFLIRKGGGGDDEYISETRAKQYYNFLIDSGLVEINENIITLTDDGKKSINGLYNKIILNAINSNILPNNVTYELLDDTILSLIDDMIPPTPAMIAERLFNNGIALVLTSSVRLALLLLPSTGRFLKGSDASLFPSEAEL